MIVFDLECRSGGHRFEGWFASSDAFADQQARGLLCCPQCGSAEVSKAASAANVARKGNQSVAALPAKTSADFSPLPPAAQEMLGKLAKMQADALKNSTWVGPSFAAQSRAMHYGDQEVTTIHGQATPSEAKGLADEGIAVMPLLIPVVPPEELN